MIPNIINDMEITVYSGCTVVDCNRMFSNRGVKIVRIEE